MAYRKKTKKTKKQVDSAVVHVQSTFNNTIATVTTTGGDVLVRCSAGRLNFKGFRRGTPYAAGQVGGFIAKEMAPLGIKTVECNLAGPGPGREAVVRALQSNNFNITVLRDVTPLPHNGCRPAKKRRV